MSNRDNIPSYYDMPITPRDYILANKFDWDIENIIKYASRCGKKGDYADWLKDLDKIIHYATMKKQALEEEHTDALLIASDLYANDMDAFEPCDHESYGISSAGTWHQCNDCPAHRSFNMSTNGGKWTDWMGVGT